MKESNMWLAEYYANVYQRTLGGRYTSFCDTHLSVAGTPVQWMAASEVHEDALDTRGQPYCVSLTPL